MNSFLTDVVDEKEQKNADKSILETVSLVYAHYVGRTYYHLCFQRDLQALVSLSTTLCCRTPKRLVDCETVL
mgnify:CR=1 FL=1